MKINILRSFSRIYWKTDIILAATLQNCVQPSLWISVSEFTFYCESLCKRDLAQSHYIVWDWIMALDLDPHGSVCIWAYSMYTVRVYTMYSISTYTTHACKDGAFWNRSSTRHHWAYSCIADMNFAQFLPTGNIRNYQLLQSRQYLGNHCCSATLNIMLTNNWN